MIIVFRSLADSREEEAPTVLFFPPAKWFIRSFLHPFTSSSLLLPNQCMSDPCNASSSNICKCSKICLFRSRLPSCKPRLCRRGGERLLLGRLKEGEAGDSSEHYAPRTVQDAESRQSVRYCTDVFSPAAGRLGKNRNLLILPVLEINVLCLDLPADHKLINCIWVYLFMMSRSSSGVINGL